VVDRHLFDQPNGLCFSPDERLLYVNDTVQALIRVFDVEADGSLANARVFASGIRSELEPGLPDGMKCDQRGNVWVTAPGGVWVYSPAGELLGKVRVPELVANLAWGGPDFRTLYPDRDAFGLCDSGQGRTAPRTLYEQPGLRAGPDTASSPPAAPQLASGDLQLDPRRCAMIIQDLQNDVIMDGGAFLDSGAPGHARQQRVVDNVRRLAEAARARASSSSMSGSSSSPARPASRSMHRCSKGWSIAARWCAEAGAPRRFRGWSRAPAISSSRRCG
jgi:gluconolactonase